MKGSSSEKKTAQCLLLAYCLFIVYGSFIPFHFNFDHNFVRWRWSIFLTESIHGRMMRVSLSDVLSNILLFVPFGILCVGRDGERSTPTNACFDVAYEHLWTAVRCHY